MALYIPHSIFHLAWLLYVRPETFHNCKASIGRVICEEHNVLERWEEYFKDLLNTELDDERMEDEETDVEIVQEVK